MPKAPARAVNTAMRILRSLLQLNSFICYLLFTIYLLFDDWVILSPTDGHGLTLIFAHALLVLLSTASSVDIPEAARAQRLAKTCLNSVSSC